MNITDTATTPFLTRSLKTATDNDIVSRLEGKVLLDGSSVLNIVLDLKSVIPALTIRGYLVLTDDLIGKINRRFRKSLNRHFFGNAALRDKKRIEYHAFLHTEPHHHIHILAELPEGRDFHSARDFVKEYCANDPWVSLNYFDDVQSVHASVRYNHRRTAELLI